jgi:4-amino-4-deoxy-L-arabinose transferase-like glycosyltransferase
MRLNPKVLLPAILVAALAARLLFCIAVVGLDSWGWGDEPDYHRHASDIAAGRGFLTPAGEPTAARPPLYPIVLAGVYRLFGPNHAAGRVLQMALGVGIVLLTYLVARKLFSSDVGLIAAAFAAVNPSLVYLSALLMTENLAIVLLLLVLLCLAKEHAEERTPLARFALGGLLGGLLCLARPHGLLFVLCVPAAALVLGKAPARRRLANAAVFTLVAALAVLPWAARNRAVLGHWVAFTTHGGITFYESNNMRIVEEPAFRGSVVLPRTAVPGWEELEPLPEIEFDRRAWEMGKQFVREHADLMPRMMMWKFERFWRFRSDLQVSSTEGAVRIEKGRSLGEIIRGIDVGWVYSIVVIPLFLLGAAATARKWRALVLLYAVVVSHTLVALAFHGSLRSRSPVEPVITIFAAAAVAGLIARARLRPLRAPAVVALAAVAAMLMFPGPARAQGEGRYENTFQKDFIMDAPWRVKDASTPIPLTIILKDCDTNDVRELHWVRCWDVTSGEVLLWGHDFGNERIGDDLYESNFWTYITTVTEGHPTLPNGTPMTPANLGYGPGSTIKLKVQIYYKDDFFNYTETRYLRVHVATAAYPWPAGWYGGDMHCHTMYTNNTAESGAPVPALVRAAGAIGLSWIVLTDHSCDLDETGDGSFSYATTHWEYTIQDQTGINAYYRVNGSIGPTWDVLGAEVALWSSASLRLARGVEMNLASIDPASSGKTLHCVVVNDAYISSPLSGGLGERPVTPSLPAGLAAIAGSGFAYAAHPASDLSAEWGGLDWGVNGALWGDENLDTALGYDAFRGLETFNTRAALYSTDEANPWGDFDAGVEPPDPYPNELLRGVLLWDADLAAGLSPLRKSFLVGGSDAHGDFNYSTYLSLNSYATDNALGKAQTVAFVPGQPPGVPATSDILAAVRAGRCIATDGPFLEIGVDGNGDGDFTDPGDLMIGDDGTAVSVESTPLTVRWASTTDFGQVVSVELVAGSAGGAATILSLDPSASGQGWSGQTTIDLASFAYDGPRYFRAQCRTANGGDSFRALTNPIWIAFDGTGVAEVSELSLAVTANPFGGSAEIELGLPSDGVATLDVYDVAGRRLGTIAAGPPVRGVRTAVWNGTDERGTRLPAGVYFFRLSQNGASVTRKGVLLR